MNELGALILAHIPALILMIIGYGLLVFEMYVPGFGVSGVTGVIFMAVGIVLMQPSPFQALILVLISIALLAIAFSITLHSICKGGLSRSKLVLNAAINNEKPESENDLTFFVGKTGQTHTALRPAGIAEFDGVKLNVVSDGDFVNARCAVRVERVEGNRIVVRRIAG